MWYMNEERTLLKNMMKEFCEKEVRPFIPRLEAGEYPRELMTKMGELGLLGFCADEEHGGQGVDWINYAIVLEEISKESNTMGLLTGLNSDWAAGSLADIASPEITEKFIAPALRGEKILGIYVTEPNGIFNIAEYDTTAVLDGDEWVINGGKVLVTNNGVADAFCVACKTGEPNTLTFQGISGIMIPADAKGVKIGANEHKLGWKGSNTGSVYFDEVRVPKEYLVGEVDNFLPYYIGKLTPGYTAYGPLALGSAERVWEKTRKFLSDRVQRGVSLWDAHQHIRFEMAEMWIEIENYRNAVYGTMANRNAGEDVSNNAIALKVKGTKLLEEVASKCIVLHGGMGTVVGTDIERYYRDAPMSAVGCGSVMSITDVLGYSL